MYSPAANHNAMKQFLLFIPTLLTFVACNKTIHVDITGQLNNNAASMVYLLVENESVVTLASAPINTDDRFHLECKVTQPSTAFLCDDNGTALTMFLTEDAPLTMRAAEGGGYKVEGGPINDKYNLIIRQLSDLATQIVNINYGAETAQEEHESLMAKGQEVRSSAIACNLDNIIGVELFINQESHNMTAEDMRVRFAQFSPQMQKLAPMRQFSKYIDILERCQVGKPFIDVNVETVTGEVIPLSSICGKGKWVLLNFWAMWCEPCLREINLLKELHSKYALMGFDICSISLDPDPERLRQFIANNQLLWFNAMNYTSEDGSSVVDNYGVNFIPTNFLISPDGIIVARDLYDEHLSHELQHRIAGNDICSFPQLHNNQIITTSKEK